MLKSLVAVAIMGMTERFKWKASTLKTICEKL